MAASKIAPKKAAKKVPGKAAKKVPGKAAKKSAGPHSAGQDVRRAYEHLHRVSVLHAQLDEPTRKELSLLSRRAEENLRAGNGRSAADLLRAAEHLAFGTLTRTTADDSLHDDLAHAVQREFEHLVFRATQHPPTDRAIARLHRSMIEGAHAAMDAKAFHRALELARGAEALTHVSSDSESALPAGKTPHTLKKQRY